MSPRLPLSILEGRRVRGSQQHKRNQHQYLELTRDRQFRKYHLVGSGDKLTKAKQEIKNANLISIVHRNPEFESGDKLWVFGHKSTITPGGKHILTGKEVGSNQK